MPTLRQLIAMSTVVLVAACDTNAPLGPAVESDGTVPLAASEAPVSHDAFIHLISGPFNWVVDMDGNEVDPADSETLLWHRDPFVPGDLLKPLLAPEGTQVTMGEFVAVEGRARAKCTNRGTHLNVHLEGLLPKGVYTLWLALWSDAIGTDPTNPFAGLLGVGAVGAQDGSDNAFVASASGEGQLTTFIVPVDQLSFGFGDGIEETCLFDEPGVDQWHVVGAYHTDGQTHGGDPGPRVEPFLFVFQN